MFKGKIASMMQQAQQIGVNVKQAKNEIKNLSAINNINKDKITIKINGEYQIQQLEIDDKIIPNKTLLINNLIMAFNDASKQITDQSTAKMKEATGNFNLPF